MRGNHCIIGRASTYVEPAHISADDLRLVQSVQLEPTTSRLIFWVTLRGLRLGQVGTFMASQVYRIKDTDKLNHCVFEWNSSEPPHARAILALLKEYGS